MTYQELAHRGELGEDHPRPQVEEHQAVQRHRVRQVVHEHLCAKFEEEGEPDEWMSKMNALEKKEKSGDKVCDRGCVTEGRLDSGTRRYYDYAMTRRCGCLIWILIL